MQSWAGNNCPIRLAWHPQTITFSPGWRSVLHFAVMCHCCGPLSQEPKTKDCSIWTHSTHDATLPGRIIQSVKDGKHLIICSVCRNMLLTCIRYHWDFVAAVSSSVPLWDYVCVLYVWYLVRQVSISTWNYFVVYSSSSLIFIVLFVFLF